ncbi:GrpB family protein [Deinococcus aquaedulcis]|uniref:GrpB family protein n=1 Tax=Deinococcus aquaedulcis TaxID=2840455 RepID=UPI001C835118|nr:GrpB family protein [Deinococcus aquaedulcis]
MTLGLKRGMVELRPWSPAYPALFEQERARVAGVLGTLASDIQHIGSTSIPGLVAKPVLDLAVAVPDQKRVAACAQPLATLGYVFMGDPVGKGEAFFARGSDEARTHYLHVLSAGHPHWHAYLTFRDALRQSADLRDDYARLKQTLAQAHPEQRRVYTNRKGEFIEQVLKGRVPSPS